RLRLQAVHLPLTPPIDGGFFMLTSVDCVLVMLDSDAGLAGEGLVFVLNDRRLKVLHEMVASLEPLVVGLDVGMSGGFPARARTETAFLGLSGVPVIAAAGVEMALWDLRAKAAGVNVARLVGAHLPS